jgi:hypothetical protein
LRSKGTPWFRPGTKLGFNIKFATKDTLRAVIGSQADFLRLQEHGGAKNPSGHRVAVPTLFWKRREEIMDRAKKPRAILKNGEGAIADRISRLSERFARAQRQIDELHAKEVLARQSGRRGLAKSIRAKRKAAELRQQNIHAQRSRAVQRLQTVTAANAAARGSLANKPFVATMKSGKTGIFVRTGGARGPIRMLFSFEDSTKVDAVLTFEASGRKVVERVWNQKFSAAFARAIATTK